MAITSNITHLSAEVEGARALDEQRADPFLAASHDVLAMVNERGIITFVSQAITWQLGYRPADIVGRHVRALVHPLDQDTLLRQVAAVRRAVGASASATYRMLGEDRSWHWFEATATHLPQAPSTGAIVLSFHDAAERPVAPHTPERAQVASDHFVQFYETDAFLLDCVSAFCSAGLRSGEACVVIATAAHLAGLEPRLEASGLDVDAARMRGELVTLDAAETLAQIMWNGSPNPQRFAGVIGGVIARAAAGGRHVRAFGEMVALLWADGAQDGAIRLEELWNDLRGTGRRFSLMCAYPMQGFAGEAFGAHFADICARHARVYPDEGYSTLPDPDERLLAVTLLQQKASSLEAEIAERLAAEERLRVSETRYRRLFEASTDAILIVDPETCGITEANPSVSTLLGYAPEELVGKEFWQIGLFPDRSAAHQALRELRRTRALHYDALPLRTSDGQRRYIELVSLLFQANGHEIIQCIMRDMTDRKQLEERKDAFISMASHELKTPVTSLKGFTQILQRRLNRQPGTEPQTLLFLDRMNAQLDKLTGLISDLLDLSKMQTGALALRETSFALDDLVRETVENVQAATQTHQLRLEGETRAQVHGDRDRLGQVLINLLTNAVKYSPGADTVIVRVSRVRAQVEVAVQDFGIGIAEDDHERVFERFYQVSDASGNTYPGLGIGLYIAQSLVALHGGRLWLESRAGAGSTFTFTLPLPPNERAAFQEPTNGASGEATCVQPGR